MLEIATPEDIQALPDIQSWLDWMRHLEEDVLGLKTQQIRQYILEGVLAHAAKNQLPISEDSFTNAQVKIRKITLPPDFDVYGDRKEFHIPTVTFSNYDELSRLFLTYGFIFRSSASLHIKPSLFRKEDSETLSTFVPSEIRPVTVLIAPNRGIEKTVATHSGFAIDPFAAKRETQEPKDRFVGKWVGLLNLARTKETEASLARELIADRLEYYRIIYPEAAKEEEEEEQEVEEEVEVDAFMASLFAQILGFDPSRGDFNLTELLVAPIFNFLQQLVEKLGYGKALSLLMRSPSLDALTEALAKDHTEIDFASTAYKDLGLIRKVINKSGTF